MRGPDTIIYLALIVSVLIGFYYGFGEPQRVRSSVIYGLSIGLAVGVFAWALDLQPLIAFLIAIASALLLAAVHRNYSPTLPARKKTYGGPWGW